MWRKKSNGDKIFDIMLIIISIAIIIVIAYPLYFVIIASFSKPEAVLGGKLRFYLLALTWNPIRWCFLKGRYGLDTATRCFTPFWERALIFCSLFWQPMHCPERICRGEHRLRYYFLYHAFRRRYDTRLYGGQKSGADRYDLGHGDS